MQWEYYSLSDQFINDDNWIAELNKLGNKGWELVSVVRVAPPSAMTMIAYFKRKL
jgi:hypothetical protein